MANWLFKIHVADVFQKAKAGDAAPQDVANAIVRELERIAPFVMLHDNLDESELDDLIEDFRELAAEPILRVSDFDLALEQLFDWGDTCLDDEWPTKKMCWVNVAFPHRSAAS